MNILTVMNGNTIRVPFRIALFTVFAVLLIGAVAVAGILSYCNLRKSADNLSAQVIDQTSSRIELWVKNLLSRATDQNQLNRTTLGVIEPGPEPFVRLAAHWQQVMETQPYFTLISVRFENGKGLSVERMKDGRMTVRESYRDRKRRTLEFQDFWPEDHRIHKAYNHKKIVFTSTGGAGGTTADSRYMTAAEAGQPLWIEARTIRKGAETVAGVSHTVPFYGPAKELRGWTSIDLDIVSVSQFLAATPVGQAGFAFIIEKPAKGEPRVIAHPTPEILTHTVVTARGLPKYEFTPYRQLKDVRVARFMEQLSRKDLDQPGEKIRIFSFTADGTEYFGSYRKMAGKDMPNWIVASIIPRREVLGLVERNNLETLGIGFVGFLLILLASTWISGRISRPLKKISDESEAIGRFELDKKPLGHSMIKEVDQLMAATDGMKRGLRSFGKYVPVDVVRDIMASGGEAEIGGRTATLTVFFSDIEGFASISEQLAPETLVEHLAEYLEEMSRQVRDEQGTVDKFIGDAIMAFWGAPLPKADHALAACRAALRCQERLAALREKWKEEGKPLFYQRIGIDTGEVIVGNMGSEHRMNYTVVGDHVNAASRFEGLNKFYGTNIMIGERTHDLVKEHFVTRPIDRVSVMGKKAGLTVYELMGDRKTTGETIAKIAQLTTEALDAYLAGRFDEAIERYEAVRALNPGDRSVGFMLLRCRQYRENPPPDTWDGIYHLENK